MPARFAGGLHSRGAEIAEGFLQAADRSQAETARIGGSGRVSHFREADSDAGRWNDHFHGPAGFQQREHQIAGRVSARLDRGGAGVVASQSGAAQADHPRQGQPDLGELESTAPGRIRASGSPGAFHLFRQNGHLRPDLTGGLEHHGPYVKFMRRSCVLRMALIPRNV